MGYAVLFSTCFVNLFDVCCRLRTLNQSDRAVKTPVADDRDYFLRVIDVGQRIAVDEYQVGDATRCDAAELSSKAKRIRRVDARRGQAHSPR